MKKLIIENCKECNKLTLQVVTSEFSVDTRMDFFSSVCLEHSNISTRNVYSPKMEFTEVLVDYDDKKSYPVNPTITEKLSVNFMKQDLYYILSMFWNFQKCKYNSGNGTSFNWEFQIKLPVNNKIIDINIGNYVGGVIKATIDPHTFNENHVEELNNVFDLFMNYVINECDDRSVGFVKTLLLSSSLSETYQARLEEIKKLYFINENSHTSFVKYPHAVSKIGELS